MSLVIAPAGHKAASLRRQALALLAADAGRRCVIFGAWEDEQFIGVVVLSRGSSNQLGSPYGLTQTQCAN